MSASEKIQLRKLKDKPRTKKNYLQNTYLRKSFYSEYIKNLTTE